MTITRAEKGTMLVQKGKEIGIGAVKVDHVVDPTGAGDAYRAGFIIGMRNGLPVEMCIKLASTVAAYAVEKKGTQNHSFTTEELKKRICKHVWASPYAVVYNPRPWTTI